MVSHSIEQRLDSIWKPELTSILSCSSWRSSQNPHVPFELERFQFFPLTVGSRVHSKKRFFQGLEGKGLQLILSLFSFSLLVFICALLVFLLSSDSITCVFMCALHVYTYAILRCFSHTTCNILYYS